MPAAFLYVDALEHPADEHPQKFLPFREEAGPKVYLLVETLPAPGTQITVWYAASYTVAEGSSDLPFELDQVVLAGAAAYACADQAVDTVDKLTPRETAPSYRALGEARLTRFAELLAQLRNRHAAPRWRVAWTPLE